MGSFRIILESFWNHFGIMLGSCWDHCRIILGSFWDQFGIILGSFWDHFVLFWVVSAGLRCTIWKWTPPRPEKHLFCFGLFRLGFVAQFGNGPPPGLKRIYSVLFCLSCFGGAPLHNLERTPQATPSRKT